MRRRSSAPRRTASCPRPPPRCGPTAAPGATRGSWRGGSPPPGTGSRHPTPRTSITTGPTRVRVSDVLAAYRDYYIPRIRQADQGRDWARSAAVFRESLTHEPPEVQRLGASRPARGTGEIALCQVLSGIHAGYAERLRAAG